MSYVSQAKVLNPFTLLKYTFFSLSILVVNKAPSNLGPRGNARVMATMTAEVLAAARAALGGHVSFKVTVRTSMPQRSPSSEPPPPSPSHQPARSAKRNDLLPPKLAWVAKYQKFSPEKSIRTNYSQRYVDSGGVVGEPKSRRAARVREFDVTKSMNMSSEWCYGPVGGTVLVAYGTNMGFPHN